MMLTDKTILIISPQHWSDMHVSKHHYSIELSKKNNKVYFLHPSSKQLDKSIELEVLDNYPNITIIHHKTFIGSRLRFHLRMLYKILLKINLKSILQHMNSIDVVISFDNTGTYPDLSLFKANKNIFFPVDQINVNHINEYKNFDSSIFSISSVILDSFKAKGLNKILLNHGLGSNWASNALKKLSLESDSSKVTDTIRVGYFGNLAIGKALDMSVLKETIETHPNIEFHFWGNYAINITLTKEITLWINFLKNANNVTLYGATPPNKLINEIDAIDAFLLCYNYQYEINKCSNSHKILEYLSTGKVIISSRISRYDNKPNLISMLTEYNNEDFNDLFDLTINNLDLNNSPEFKKVRIEYALDNTYEKQIDRIETYIKNDI